MVPHTPISHMIDQRLVMEMKISYPESSDSLASGWSLGETLGYWNFIPGGFLWQNNAVTELIQSSQSKHLIAFRILPSLSLHLPIDQKA